MTGKTAIAAILPFLAIAAAPAPTPEEAFACNLSYKEAMQSLASLKVREQKRGASLLFVLGYGPLTTTIFDPGNVRLFGVQPSSLVLDLHEPKSDSPDSEILAEFIAEFARSDATDNAILNGIAWRDAQACRAFNYCIGTRNSPLHGIPNYDRKSPDTLTLVCEFRMTLRELEKL